MTNQIVINPKLDLVFERETKLTPQQIWQAWTHPKTLMKWFCPKPWKVTDCRIDLRPGGEFYTFMQGPAGETSPNNGCILEFIENKKFVVTNMMTANFCPQINSDMGFAYVIILLISKTEAGTQYKAIVRHADEEGCKKHEQMGFQEGWGAAFKQLVELMPN